MTNILAFDTSADACSVAIQYGDSAAVEKTVSTHQIAPMQQSKLILSTIDQLLLSVDLELGALDAIAFGAGPGSFTGLRLATSVVQGLGFVADVPLIPISSLAALAQTVYMDNHDWRPVVVAMDARKNQFYWAEYHLDDAFCMVLQGEERLLSISDPFSVKSEQFYAVGDAWSIYRETLCQLQPQPIAIDHALKAPKATALLVLAQQKYKKKDWISPFDALPVYLNPFKR